MIRRTVPVHYNEILQSILVEEEYNVVQLDNVIVDVHGKFKKDETLLRDEERSIIASLNGIILPSSGCFW